MFTRLHQTKYVVILVLTPLLLFWRWVVLGEVLYWGTILLQFWPWRWLVNNSLTAGEWPLWNPLLGNGTPLLANHQSAVFYPLNWLNLLLPVEHGLTLSVVLHLMIAGLTMYFYGRYLGLSPFPASIAALSYMYSGYIIGRTQFVVMVNAAAWIPLILLLGDRLATRRTLSAALWLAVALALQLLAGHAQLWFYSVLLLGAYMLYRSWQEMRSIKGLFQSGLWLGGVLGGVCLLTAVQLLPTAEFVAESPRSSGAEQYEALTYSFWPWRIITLVAPDFFGSPAQGNFWGYATYWEDHAYMGMLPTVLALATLVYYLFGGLNLKDHPSASPAQLAAKVIPFFGICIPVSLLLAMGWNTPLYLWLFDYVPGFGFFRAPARLLIWYTVSMAVLAGIGAQYISVSGTLRRYWLRLLTVAFALFIGAVVAALIISDQRLTFFPATQKAGLLLAAAIGLYLLRPAGAGTGFLTRSRWQGVVVAFVTIDLLVAAYPLIPTMPDSIFKTPIATAAPLKRHSQFPRYFVDQEFAYQVTFNHYFTFDDFGPRDEAYWQSFRSTLVPNLGVHAQLPSANNNDPLVVDRWQTLAGIINLSGPNQSDLLPAIMGVQYKINGYSASDQTPAGDINIQPVNNALPHAYFVGGVRYAATATEALTLLLGPHFDYRREVVIIGEGQDRRPQRAEGTVTVTALSNNSISLNVVTEEPGYLVVTDTYYPGWVATIDDEPVPLSLANVTFRAVYVEPGVHTVIMRYRPVSFYAGLVITVITLLFTGGYILKTGFF
jgi:hypothetical protein